MGGIQTKTNKKTIRKIKWQNTECQQACAGFLALTAASCLLMGWKDGLMVLQWQLYFLMLGLLSLPLWMQIFGKRNYLLPFASMLGLLLPGFCQWAISAVTGWEFTAAHCYIVLLGYGIGNLICYMRNPKKQDIQQMAPQLLKQELLFYALFLFWAYLIGFQASAYGTEKFMDYAFLQKMLTSTKLPPEDMWYAGKSINYYYGGQYFAAFIAKSMLFGKTKAQYAYNLMRAIIPAFVFVETFGLGRQILNGKYKKNGKKEALFAALSAAAVTFGGNFHYVIYGILKPFFAVSGEQTYWFPDSTRYIGYNPVVENDQTIHEFPCYSFILGDLHAHMINLMFVLLLLAVLYAWMTEAKQKNLTVRSFRFPQVYLLGLLLGVFHWTNYWDYIIYAVVILCVVLFTNLAWRKSWKTAMGRTMVQLVMIGIISVFVSIPFTDYFESVFQGVGIAQHHSRLYQLFVLWGLALSICILFFVVWIRSSWKKHLGETIQYIRARITPEELFIIILACCAIGLVLIPELVYVKDIYEATHARANTMFKLTYQAFLLFGVCSGYMLYDLTKTGKGSVKAVSYVLIALEALSLGYFFNASDAWFGNWMLPGNRQGLDALCYLDGDEFQSEKNALLWLKEKVESGDITGVIAEAPGSSYTACERVSTITGLSTPAGWLVHEWLWRDSYDGIKDRSDDVNRLYTEGDTEVLERYNIQYIFFGARETEAYGEEAKENIKKLGTVVYEDEGAVIVRVGK